MARTVDPRTDRTGAAAVATEIVGAARYGRRMPFG
jgi:hypothetical protein